MGLFQSECTSTCVNTGVQLLEVHCVSEDHWHLHISVVHGAGENTPTHYTLTPFKWK